MSFRKEARTIDERVAALEQAMRQTQASVAGDNLGTGIDPSIIAEVGDLIVGAGPSTPARLGPGEPGDVLTMDGPEPTWEPPAPTVSQAAFDDLTMLVWLGGPA